MGYANEEFGYRLWDLVEKKIIRSRDAVFFEDIRKGVNIVSSSEYPINLDPVPFPELYGGDVTKNIGDVENDP